MKDVITRIEFFMVDFSTREQFSPTEIFEGTYG